MCEEGGALPATKGMSRILKRYKERKWGSGEPFVSIVINALELIKIDLV